MSVAAFDTLKFVRALREKAKLSPEQAEGFADAIAEAIQSDLSTKADINGVKSDIRETEGRLDAGLRGAESRLEANVRETESRLEANLRETESRLEANLRETELNLKADIRELELRMEARIEASKAEIIKWMFGTIGFQTLIILGAVIALSRLLQP